VRKQPSVARVPTLLHHILFVSCSERVLGGSLSSQATNPLAIDSPPPLLFSGLASGQQKGTHMDLTRDWEPEEFPLLLARNATESIVRDWAPERDGESRFSSGQYGGEWQRGQSRQTHSVPMQAQHDSTSAATAAALWQRNLEASHPQVISQSVNWSEMNDMQARAQHHSSAGPPTVTWPKREEKVPPVPWRGAETRLGAPQRESATEAVDDQPCPHMELPGTRVARSGESSQGQVQGHEQRTNRPQQMQAERDTAGASDCDLYEQHANSRRMRRRIEHDAGSRDWSSSCAGEVPDFGDDEIATSPRHRVPLPAHRSSHLVPASPHRSPTLPSSVPQRTDLREPVYAYSSASAAPIIAPACGTSQSTIKPTAVRNTASFLSASMPQVAVTSTDECNDATESDRASNISTEHSKGRCSGPSASKRKMPPFGNLTVRVEGGPSDEVGDAELSQADMPKKAKRKRLRRECQFDGCGKAARGSTLFCISHGGGKRCQYPEGCDKSAQGSTLFCNAHGGGKRCQYPEDCDKGAQGSTLFCKAHGGGKRCQYPEGCGKGAQDSTLFCKAHGGGKRCQYPEGCVKSAIGATLFCKAHGGGKRCQYPEGCAKSAVGSTLFCISHGGGKRCQFSEGCDKSAKGSTLFCVSHGGGKRCQYPEGCHKSAQGSTSFCKAHGGGKRCQYPEGCAKSAVGSTLFCKAHGGGKRCQYPEGCDKSARGSTLFCVAHGGGKGCQYPEGCDKIARAPTLFCTAHGGGKRCQYPGDCDKGAEGSTLFCKAHGGGKRCQYPEGCDRSARGLTLFCTAHGGGKRCQYPEGCAKGAKGSTLFCRAHGGGKRCQYPDGCAKSARGSTLFCTAHGGGKRCQYPEGCVKGAQGSTFFCISHGGGKRCK
jgi:hypothetical protein